MRTLSPLQRAAYLELIKRGIRLGEGRLAVGTSAAPLSFRQFVSVVKPSFQWYRHTLILATVLQKVADDELSRVMIFMPPRHGKSEETSRLFAAYYLYRHPERFVGINSYSADLAYTLSRAARENYKSGGGKTKSDADAVKQWETPENGGVWAAGVGGPITGKGFHLGIIDDPTKNAEDAESETLRVKERDWYNSTFYTRAEPGAAIVIIQTRWNSQDLSGWLLSQEIDEDEEQPERWHIVCFPAITDTVPQDFPASCTVEPDWRNPGEALCPERYPLERLLKIAKRIGGYFWDALFNQRPTAKEGGFFKPGMIEIVDALPAGLRLTRHWDIAASSGKGDFTVGVKMATDGKGRFWLVDIARGQWGPDEADTQILSAARQDGRTVSIGLPQDPGAAGKRDAAALVRMLQGFHVASERVTGSKEVRARAFASQVNAGNVRMLRAPWNTAALNELRTFPRGDHDDIIDAAGDAFDGLTSTSVAGPIMVGGQRLQPQGVR